MSNYRETEFYVINVKSINRMIYFSFAFLFLGWMWCIFSFFSDWPMNIGVGNAFSKSGSILTIASLGASIASGEIVSRIIGDGGFGKLGVNELLEDTKSNRKNLKNFSNISAFLGTIIWGYGELLHQYVFNKFCG